MNYSLQISPDPDPPNPREWDNMGTMICFHSRYNLGDETELTSKDFDGWSDLRKHLIKKKEAAVILPLYLYDHSGLAMSTHPFSCPWDSGQVGFVYVSREKLFEEYPKPIKYITNSVKIWAEGVLRTEVEIYGRYLNRNAWSYEVLDEEGKVVDSGWEYDDEDYCRKEGQMALELVEKGLL
jgi:hypothetical protein